MRTKPKTTYKKRLEADTGQGQLLIEIIENHGKAESVCKKAGLDYMLLSYWRTSGHVPLSRVGEVARALKESIYAFNYEAVVKLLGEGPKWEDVVKGCHLSGIKQQLVLSKSKPRSIKEIIA